MSTEPNEEVVRRFIEAINAQDYDDKVVARLATRGGHEGEWEGI